MNLIALLARGKGGPSTGRPLSLIERVTLAVLLIAWAGALVMVVSIARLRSVPMAVLGLETVGIALIVYRAALIVVGHRQ